MKKLKKYLILLGLSAVLGACTPSAETHTVKIAAKPMTEQFILAEMLALLIEEHTDLKAEITKGIGGGTANIHPALLKGEFDLYPEYTGTAWLYVLKRPEAAAGSDIFPQLAQAYRQQFQLEWVGLYGFNNTFGLAVPRDWAQANQVRSYSDLARFSPQLRFGAEYDFYERSDGYDALVKSYGFQFKEKRDLDIGLKYRALADGQIDAVNIFTTDAALAGGKVAVLTDDKKLYPDYYAGTVIRAETLAKYPELKAVLEKMNRVLSNDEMARLNAEVENGGQDERSVAQAFLQGKGLIR
ncbi:glycine betaine ABC transporter substrate-binding protein [Conchiformibius steedae]|uniref:glycine betaine ABC transporter substrate-binding protein n=1 Tax=Conchiformibius steedae TaxID=153493 RepID=UPI001C8957DF|nr:glycine betaine ABC transporter substrate-binding protein [Conchiformibius steedae]